MLFRLSSILYLSLIFHFVATAQSFNGYFNFKWMPDSGTVELALDESRLGERFLYVTGLTAGLGSNDIGLDRGQLGDQKVVYWYVSGNKLLLIQDNLKFRAISRNDQEVRAVNEAFAESVIFGFKITEKVGSTIKVSLNNFLLRDAHHISAKLQENKEGVYKIDKTKSAIYKEALFSFPDNSEFESILTFVGEPKGKYVETVSPDNRIISLRQHHSFIRLPDENYTSRKFMPESGYIYEEYYDYATDIAEPLVKKHIIRHRLKKKFPERSKSPPIEPIVYYIDPGCPEPVRSALIEGAQWWNEAFEVAGFENAFQVEDLPLDAHPLDVRYNLIQWVHRSTRGWSYGGSITDPRTGEVIKGHVSLGSLRVRQDYMIAQGLISKSDSLSKKQMKQMALDRLKQLSAHEIGHTIGLSHNFAASYNNRASVMDYPHPLVTRSRSNILQFKDAYDQGIGEWDKRAILYGYGYPENESEQAFLERVIRENHENELLFITDQDARPEGGIHPYAHLWDNGKNPAQELDRIVSLRKHTLANLSVAALPLGTPLSELEKILVPIYLMHRYQVDATSKLIGGIQFSYETKSDDRPQGQKPIEKNLQVKALNSILSTLEPDFLKIPDDVLETVLPPAYGYERDRETFKGKTGQMFDPMAAAMASANHSFKFLLNAQRLERIHQQSIFGTCGDYLNLIQNHCNKINDSQPRYGEILNYLFCVHLIKLTQDGKSSPMVAMQANQVLNSFLEGASGELFANWMKSSIESKDKFKLPELPKLPPGSPIGCY